MDKQSITIKTTINLPVESVWRYFTEPEHIKNWNNASDDWHTTEADNDLQIGGKFRSRMEAKDGSFGFDFSGVYDDIKLYEKIAYTIEDGRKVVIIFKCEEESTDITETFDAESENSLEMQKAGWQAILDNFKKYVEEINQRNK
jgi:uncharacterized protein YndB with AHSA1/START domain